MWKMGKWFWRVPAETPSRSSTARDWSVINNDWCAGGTTRAHAVTKYNMQIRNWLLHLSWIFFTISTLDIIFKYLHSLSILQNVYVLKLQCFYLAQ
jgi:hypothetical protein